MNNIDSVIAKVKTLLEDYDSSGLIDEDIIYDDAITAMKAFGNDITIFKEDVLELKDGKVILPIDFYSISTVMLVEPFRCNNSAIEYRTLVGLSFIEDTKILKENWNECNDCCRNMENKYIRKEHYISNNVATIDYKKGKFLKQGKTFDKSICNDDIREVWRKDEEDEFIIVGKELRTNLRNGSLYIVYKGFTTDEDGNIDIPDTPNGHLYDHLENVLMSKTSLQLMLKTKGSIPMLGQIYQTFDSKSRLSRHNASTDLRMMNFNLKRFANKIETGNKISAKISSVI